MEFEGEIWLDDDEEILDIIRLGFPRHFYERTNFFDELDDLSFFKRFRLTKRTVLFLLGRIEDQLELNNNL